jgi:hypothetical protein
MTAPAPRPAAGPNSLLKAALAYAALGWPVFPLAPRGKVPLAALAPHGVKDATTDAATIREWWKREPNANIGIATGAIAGIDVVDLDVKHDGRRMLADREDEHGRIETLKVETGSGGQHLYFRHEEEVRNSAGRLPGIDVRGDGGYVVAPPSIHPNGRPYRWADASAHGTDPIAAWPSWLLAALNPEKRAMAAPSADGAIVEGKRNAVLTSLAGSMRRRGMSHEAMLAALLAENDRRCRPPLEPAEVARIAKSIATYSPEASVDAVLDAAGFADLKAPLSGERLELLLGNLQARANGEGPVRRAALREEAIRRLRAAGVRSPAKALDAALGTGADGGHPEPKQGRALERSAPDPWPEPVEGAALLEELATTLRKYLVLPPHAAEALGLWILHSYTWRTAADFSPRLGITGPTMRCGKSRVLEVLSGLVDRPLSTVNITPAALFRAVERHEPTLLIDEGDTFLGDAEGLRGLLNAGQRRGGCVLRTVGEDFEPREFSVFGPVAIASIGSLPGTVRDRTILICMRRKTKTETIARLRLEKFRNVESLPLRRKAARWARDHEAGLRAARPTFPETLDDRAADGWEPLLAIADAAGGLWPTRAREAAVALSAGRGEANDAGGAMGVVLLRDLRDNFAARGVDRLPSEEIVKALRAMEDRPWPEFGRSRKPITQHGVARLLRPFGISPRTIRLPGGDTAKGYLREGFGDAWLRYLEADGVPNRHTVTTSEFEVYEANSATQGTVTESDCDGSKNHADRLETPEFARSDGVTVRKGESGGKNKNGPCRTCGATDRWQALAGDLRCRRCHPPGPGAEVP